MAKYVYPAIFTPESNGAYSVVFPDLEGCYTCGDNLADAIEMSEDALSLALYGLEKRSGAIPSPSDHLDVSGNDFVNMIMCDTLEYHKRNNSKAVKKTLSIPEWLNELATEADINFSQVLQRALKSELGIA